MKVSFRKASSRDLKRLNEIVNDKKTARYLNVILPVSLESTRKFYEQHTKGKGLFCCIMADGNIAGSLSIRFGRKDSKQAHLAEFGLCIAREYWGRGLGGKAIDFIIKQARKNKIKRVDFEVVKDNKKAIKLYEKKGFKKEGVKKKSFKIGNKFHDTVVMARLLK
ncbi:MAG: GNAT family N-acetyltransferase [Candidatus Altiarchaeales archaeon]|nr:GNAT family N-acetyltransferase [Candidatus Altiarchaeales archaeon]